MRAVRTARATSPCAASALPSAFRPHPHLLSRAREPLRHLPSLTCFPCARVTMSVLRSLTSAGERLVLRASRALSAPPLRSSLLSLLRPLHRPAAPNASSPLLSSLSPVRALPLRGMSQAGVVFSPFPRNELEILEFNLRQQIKKRRELVLAKTTQIIEQHNDDPNPPTTFDVCFSPHSLALSTLCPARSCSRPSFPFLSTGSQLKPRRA